MGRYIISVDFANGSSDVNQQFHTYTAAMDYARDGISYSGGRVAHVRLIERNSHRPDQVLSIRDLWDARWTDESKRAGLRNAP
jgi:hypothetical protein